MITFKLSSNLTFVSTVGHVKWAGYSYNWDSRQSDLGFLSPVSRLGLGWSRVECGQQSRGAVCWLEWDSSRRHESSFSWVWLQSVTCDILRDTSVTSSSQHGSEAMGADIETWRPSTQHVTIYKPLKSFDFKSVGVTQIVADSEPLASMNMKWLSNWNSILPQWLCDWQLIKYWSFGKFTHLWF